MSKNSIILLLGLWVALVPFLGFPGAWKTFFIVVSGLAIAVLSILIALKERARSRAHLTDSIPDNKRTPVMSDIKEVRVNEENRF